MMLWCATLTPFREGRPDLERVGAHVRWLAERGVQGFAPTGTTGEFLYLRAEEKAEIHRVTQEAAEGAPVMPCVFDPDPGIMLDLARRAQDRGAFGVFTPPPLYHPLHPDDILAWYRPLVQALSIPVYAYHHPRTHNPLDFPVLERLFEIGVRGMKDSSSDERRVRFLAQCFPDRLIVGGDDMLGKGKGLGPVQGHMSALANLRPRLCRSLVDLGPKAEEPARQRDAAMAAVAAAGRLPAMKQALGMGCRPPITWFDPASIGQVVPDP